MIKLTSADTPELSALLSLEEKMRAILREVNEQTRQSINIQKLIEVTMTLDVSDLVVELGGLSLSISHREFVSQTNVRCTQQGEGTREGAIFLFNDIAIFAKNTPKKKKMKGRSLFLMDTFLFRSTPSSPLSVCLLSSEQTITLDFETEQEAVKWRRKANEIAEVRVREELERVSEQGVLDQTYSRDIKLSDNVTISAPFPIERVQQVILMKRIQAIQEQSLDLPRSIFSTKIPSPRRGKREDSKSKEAFLPAASKTPPNTGKEEREGR